MNADSLQTRLNILKAFYSAMGVAIELLEAELKIARKRPNIVCE